MPKSKNYNLISINDLTRSQIQAIFLRAEDYFINNKTDYKYSTSLSGKVLINFFFESSTRTRTSFEIAAKRLGCDVVNIDISLSSLKKDETIIDTTKTLNAMRPDFVAIRHNSSGIVRLLANYINAIVINAGDGTNEHPTQSLLDAFVINKHKGKIKGLKIAICGDVLHSRVARSNIMLLSKMGAKVNLITPPTLITSGFEAWLKENWNIKVYQVLEEGIENVDVIMMLRIQQERMTSCYIPSLNEYYKLYGLNHNKLQYAKKDVMILNPGPINREVEISSDLADDKSFSLILEQVEAGVAVRQAILEVLFNKE